MDFEPDYIGARKTLMTGFTTVRDVGSSDFLDVGLRNSIDAGAVHVTERLVISQVGRVPYMGPDNMTEPPCCSIFLFIPRGEARLRRFLQDS